mgnify:CR=1 FL=1
MRVKNVIIGIKGIDEVLLDAKNVMKKLEKGDSVKKQAAGVYFENLEVMRKAITGERLRILRIIKEKHPASLYALAKLLVAKQSQPERK